MAIDEDDDIIPGFETAPRPGKQGRYSVVPSKVKWTAREELVLFAVLPYCGTRAVYRTCCLFLCHVLGRQPAYPSTARPSGEQQKTDACSIIERRVVTSVLRLESPDTVKLAEELYCGHRVGKPLTWAEQVEFLLPYAKKNRSVDVGEFLRLLGRSEDDWPMISPVFNKAMGSKKVDPPAENFRADPVRHARLGAFVQEFVGGPEETIVISWGNLVRTLNEE